MPLFRIIAVLLTGLVFALTFTRASMAQTDTLPNFDKLWNYGDPAATAATFRELLPQAQSSEDTDYYAQLLTQVARTESLQGHFAESDSILDDVQKVLTEETAVARARYLLERGRIQNSSGHPDNAMPYFREAYDVASTAGSMRHAIDALHMLGIAAATPKEQVEWNLKGIAAAEEYPDQKGWLWALYNNIGESYLKLQDYTNAHRYFTKLADHQRERSGSVDVYTQKDIAKLDRLMGRPEKALPVMQQLLDTLTVSGEDNGYFRLELGEDLTALGRSDEAKPHFLKAYELLSTDNWFIENEPESFTRLKSLTGH